MADGDRREEAEQPAEDQRQVVDLAGAGSTSGRPDRAGYPAQP